MGKRFTQILIVDDDRIHLFTIQKLLLLSQKGVQLMSYRGAVQALQFLRKNASAEDRLPDIILLDLNMPGWDGRRFLKEYDKISPLLSKKIRLYIISSSPNEEDIAGAMRNPHVCDYLQKPLTLDAINHVFEQNLVK